MNDKIKLFNEQSIKYAQTQLNDIAIVNKSGIMYNYNDLYTEKFAELIVKECINEIAYIGKANEVFGDRTDRGGLNHILWTTETAIEKIKQHFGVKE